MRPKLFVELCCGASAVSLQLLGGRRCVPPVAWLGGKRRFAYAILRILGLVPGDGADHFLWVDAGPWGWVWPVLLDPEISAAVADSLRDWSSEDPEELWNRLAAEPPPAEIVDRTAQWLWLQARSVNNVPVFWSEDLAGWEKAKHPGQYTPQKAAQRGVWKKGSRPGRSAEPAAQQGLGGRWERQTSRPRATPTEAIQPRGTTNTRASGIQSPATLADRIEGLGRWEMGAGVNQGPNSSSQKAQQTVGAEGRPHGMRSTETVAERIEQAQWMMEESTGAPTEARQRGSRDRTSRHPELLADRVEETPKWMMASSNGWAHRGLATSGRSDRHGGDSLPERIKGAAQFLVLQAGSARGRPVEVNSEAWKTNGYAHLSDSARERGFTHRIDVGRLADAVEAVVRPPITVVHGDVTGVLPRADETGTIVYIDPPYLGRTGYGWGLDRDKLIALMLAWDAAGAIVCVSEGVPLDLSGWHHIEITHVASGIVRGEEWLTLNRPPAYFPPKQVEMF